MAAGTPVVAADATALPQTCGNAALLIDPNDAPAFADALLLATTDEPTRNTLKTAGLERAAEFTWDRTARETDRVLSELLSERG